jgi:hypothetical protein
MAVNLSAIKDLLLPGLRGVEGKYEQIPSQYDKIFTKHESKMALERTAEMRFLGLAQLKTEGGQTAFDNSLASVTSITKSTLKLLSAMRSLAKLSMTTCTRHSLCRRTSA